MANFIQSSDVAGGRIRTVCPRCDRIAYMEVPHDSRRRVLRCRCGKSTSYSINYRKDKRETAYGPAKVILRNSTEQKARLNDTSIGGISFYISPEHAMSMSRGQEISIKFRAGGSSMIQRKICIRSIIKNRIGAQYMKNYVIW